MRIIAAFVAGVLTGAAIGVTWVVGMYLMDKDVDC